MLAGEVLNRLLEARISRHAASLRVILAQRSLNIGLGGNAQFDLRAVQQMPYAINRVEVGGVRDGDGDIVVVFEDRHHPVFSGDVPRDCGNDIVGDLHLAQVNDFGAEMGGLGLGDIPRLHHPVGHQEIHHPHARGLRFLPRLGHPLGGYEPKVNQDVS